MRGAVVAATAVSVVLVTCACGGGSPSARERFRVHTGSDSPVRHVEDDASPALVLWVSNQSFRKDDVGITVRIDDVPVIDGAFPVQDETNWVHFPLALEPGDHELVAQSTDGVRQVASFSTPAPPAGVHAVLSYWFSLDDGSQPYFDWQLSDEPFQFG
jgi:hypothetical protein